jgi:hypothetical protein
MWSSQESTHIIRRRRRKNGEHRQTRARGSLSASLRILNSSRKS